MNLNKHKEISLLLEQSLVWNGECNGTRNCFEIQFNKLTGNKTTHVVNLKADRNQVVVAVGISTVRKKFAVELSERIGSIVMQRPDIGSAERLKQRSILLLNIGTQ